MFLILSIPFLFRFQRICESHSNIYLNQHPFSSLTTSINQILTQSPKLNLNDRQIFSQDSKLNHGNRVYIPISSHKNSKWNYNKLAWTCETVHKWCIFKDCLLENIELKYWAPFIVIFIWDSKKKDYFLLWL